MSLLADLLSKIKQPQPTREVPPNLQSIVQSSALKSASRRKTYIISGMVIFFVLSGIIAVYVINSITETSDIGVAQPPLIAKSGETPGRQASAVKAMKRTDDKQSGQEIVMPARPAKIVKKKIRDQKQSPAARVSDNAAVTSRIKHHADVPAIAIEETKEIDIAARDALLYKAREYEMKQDYSSALGTYKEVLEIDSDNVMVLNTIAYIYLTLGIFQESIQYALMAEELDVDYTPALINLGIAYAKSGNVTAAEYYLDRAFTLEPDNKSAILNLALLNERNQNYSGAAGYFTKLIKLGDTAGTLGLARVYEKQGNTTESLRLYKKAALMESLNRQKRRQIRQRISVLQNEGKAEVNAMSTGPADATQ